MADAEAVRKHLIRDKPWSVLGQSYGGFCALTYLSLHPEALTEVLIANGTPSLDASPNDVYRSVVKTLTKRTEVLYELPNARKQTVAILEHLRNSQVFLPNGEQLSSRRFGQLGFYLDSRGGLERLYFLLQDAFYHVDGQLQLTPYFLKSVSRYLKIFENPIYTVLHESIYAQNGPTQWAGQHVHEESGLPYSSEIIFAWMFDEYEVLKPYKSVALELAIRRNWDPLYDSEVLARNTVPVAALIGFDDLYVPSDLSLITAERVKGMKRLISPKSHSELKDDPKGVVETLKLLNGTCNS